MSEFSYSPNTRKTTQQQQQQLSSSLLLYDFYLFCSFIISHPLYFSYFIFFSPYIIKILSFLSPLFITTSLLLLALFTNLVQHEHQIPESKVISFYHNVLNKLQSSSGTNIEDQTNEFQQFEEKAYEIVFDMSSEHHHHHDQQPYLKEEALVDKHSINESAYEKTIETDNKFVDVSCEKVEKEVKDIEEHKAKVLPSSESKAIETDNEFVNVPCEKEEEVNKEEDTKQHKPKLLLSKKSECKAMEENMIVTKEAKVRDLNNNIFQGGDEYYSPSMGSMRREKEWRRTLACKLFEERHNVDAGGGGAEGMDVLWETYEADSSKVALAKSKTTKKKGKKGVNKYYDHDDEEGDDDDDEEREIDNGQLCCLQALKFSAGKMNMGMGRPNLVKFSKAIKGIGWLHKHAKKVYH